MSRRCPEYGGDNWGRYSGKDGFRRAAPNRGVLTNVTLLTRRQVAETLAISLRTVDELIRTGDLPVVRLGGKSVRFRPAAIQLFVEASESRRNPRTAARNAKKCARRKPLIEAAANAGANQ